MSKDNRTTNRALVEFILLPTVFLASALLGGLRVSAERSAFIFLPPPLVTLLLAVMLLVLAARGRLIDFGRWLSAENGALANVSHALTLLALFFATAQSFNSVLPEAGLLRWMFSFFFLWTLWTYQFAVFDARRLLRGLTVLFATAFVVKHLLLASLYEPGGGWLRRVTSLLLEGVTLGTLDAPAYAPSTGYISFFALALYVAGLMLMPSAPEAEDTTQPQLDEVVAAYSQLPAETRAEVRRRIISESVDAEDTRLLASGTDTDDVPDGESAEETLVGKRK